MTHTPDENSTAIERTSSPRRCIDSEQTTEAEPPVFTASDALADAPAEESEAESEAESIPVAASPHTRKGIEVLGSWPSACCPRWLWSSRWPPVGSIWRQRRHRGAHGPHRVRAGRQGHHDHPVVVPARQGRTTVDRRSEAADRWLQGGLHDLTNDVVIPGAKEKQISAVATVQRQHRSRRPQPGGGAGVRQPDGRRRRRPTQRHGIELAGDVWRRSTASG